MSGKTPNSNPVPERLHDQMFEAIDEELELEFDDHRLESALPDLLERPRKDSLDRHTYFKELLRLQRELIKLQDWVVHHKLKLMVLFEGRDAAGKGGVIKRITQRLNPRICKVVALSAPTERERTQWYFQRYVEHLPAAGEICLFDRSWYNRAGVEKVMGFCTPAEHHRFLKQCPVFERMLVEDGIRLIKFWFSVSDEEQEARFRQRIEDPTRRWKLSEIDLHARSRWVDFSRAKDEMFVHTDTPECPWYVVEADDKRRARINCIAHLLSLIPYEDRTPDLFDVPERQPDDGYVRPDRSVNTYVPDYAAALELQ